MDQTQYARLTEMPGRWKADILESFLRSEQLDLVLIQDSVAGTPQRTSFAPVKIFVLKASLQGGRRSLHSFDEN
jgi:hypothetical protein